jgi:hypothetical protein
VHGAPTREIDRNPSDGNEDNTSGILSLRLSTACSLSTPLTCAVTADDRMTLEAVFGRQGRFSLSLLSSLPVPTLACSENADTGRACLLSSLLRLVSIVLEGRMAHPAGDLGRCNELRRCAPGSLQSRLIHCWAGTRHVARVYPPCLEAASASAEKSPESSKAVYNGPLRVPSSPKSGAGLRTRPAVDARACEERWWYAGVRIACRVFGGMLPVESPGSRVRGRALLSPEVVLSTYRAWHCESDMASNDLRWEGQTLTSRLCRFLLTPFRSPRLGRPHPGHHASVRERGSQPPCAGRLNVGQRLVAGS